MARIPNPSCLDLVAVAAALDASGRRFDIDAVAECDSTNTRLLAQAETGAASGRVLVADRQTTGRGRRGRAWYSAPGDSLTFSLLWRFRPDSSAPVGLSLAVGVALVNALDELGVGDASLKWPNDVLHGGRKLAGILVELQPGDARSAVIGIGLNLRLPNGMPADIAKTAIGLYAMSPRADRENILATVLVNLARTLDIYSVGGFSTLRETWLLHHAFQDQAVRITGDGMDLTGNCLGVDREGALLIATDTGLKRIISGEVTLRNAVETPHDSLH